MSKHTPGPWHAETLAGREGWRVTSTKGSVALLPDGETTGPRYEQDANAALIAAAPEMLEALKGAVAWCHQGHGGFPRKQCGLCKPLLAAIAKATGGEP